MGFLFLGLVALAIWIVTLVTRINRLELIIKQFERNAEEHFAKSSAVRALTARVDHLEAGAHQAPPRVAQPAASPSAPPTPSPARVAVPQPHAAAQTPVPPLAAAPRRPVEVPQPPASATPPPDSDQAWEVRVGGSWLNKIGVLVSVIGLALLVGYSMTHVGPAGRLAIGFVISIVMLAGGVAMERRADYKTYAHGLIAGGWAGIYFTSYAMRAVDAARVLDSDAVAVVLLLAVACGMVWHSLRYRSQELTALAYVVAFATLALTPLRGFALVASVPLALSVIVVAGRFAWPRVQVLGVVCTYGLYILRGQTFGFGDLDLTTFTPYLALAIYWIVFEAADIAALARRQADSPPPEPLFLLNAAGLVGGALLQLPMETPVPLSIFLWLGGVAYLGSAVLRAWLIGRTDAGNDGAEEAARGSYQGACILAASFVVWAIELRLGGSQRTLALLVEAELLFLSGLILRDWLIRGLGSAVAILVSLHAVIAIAGPVVVPEWTWAGQREIALALLTAALWYANREALRSRRIPPLLQEWPYTPVATYLIVLVARADLPDGYSAFALFGFAWLLIEAGLHLGREYRYQAYVVGSSSALVLLGWFTGQPYFSSDPTTGDAWWMLGGSALVAWMAAWRMMAPDAEHAHQRERAIAAGMAAVIGTACLVTLLWKVVAPDYVGLAWGATAAAIGGVGLWRGVDGLRWQLYPLLALALLRVMIPILNPSAATSTQLASALLVIGLAYAGSLAVRAAITDAPTHAEVEDAVRISVSAVASLALAALIYTQVRPPLVTLTWGFQAAALLVTGFPARERLMRLSGLGVLTACVLRLFTYDLPQLDELARIISFVALGAVLLMVSWVYTRYRDRIQKYL